MGDIQTVFPDISPISEREVWPHYWRCRYASCQNGAQFCCRATGILATRASPDIVSSSHTGACGSCGQHGEKHPAAVSHTAAENTINDARYSDAICCSSPCNTSRLCRPPRLCITWIPWKPIQLLWSRRTRLTKNRNWCGGCGGQAKSNLTHYCWTHGMCARTGKDYSNLADRHKRTWRGVTRCREVKETASDRSVWYLQIIIM